MGKRPLCSVEKVDFFRGVENVNGGKLVHNQRELASVKIFGYESCM